MITKQFQLNNNEGLYSYPETNTKQSPAVLLIHGLALNMHEPGYDQLNDLLVEAGFAVYRMNLSSDEYITLSSWATEVTGLYDFVKERGHQKISIVAHSLGAAATIVSQLPLQRLVLLAPACDFVETMKNVFKDGFNLDGVSVRKWSETFETRLGPEFLHDTKQYDLVQLIKQQQTPLLYVHGTLDNKVMLNSSYKLYEQAGTSVKQEYIGQFNHMLNPDRETIFQIITQWLIS